VFRTYGGVEAFVGELWIGETAYFKVSKEELRRFVEEAKRTAPDLSGIKKIWQTLEWLRHRRVVSGRDRGRHRPSWQLRWYFALFGEPESFSGGASVTRRASSPTSLCAGVGREDRIIAEGRAMAGVSAGPRRQELAGAGRRHRLELGPGEGRGAGRRVEALDWPREMSDAEREGLGEEDAWASWRSSSTSPRRGGVWTTANGVRRGPRGWREAVEALSGGRIAGDTPRAGQADYLLRREA
jgi:hypothetical protein